MGVQRLRSSGAHTDLRTPHSGYHLRSYSQSSRFFEGWYLRVTLPGHAQSFALIHSAEDQHMSTSRLRGVSSQVMAPSDTYLCFHTPFTNCFWAHEHQLSLGASYSPLNASTGELSSARLTELVHSPSFQGFQQTSRHTAGRVVSDDRSAGVGPASSAHECRWNIDITPVYGWGPPCQPQRATAGWLSSLPVFEPHWQALMAHGRASGWIELDGEQYPLNDAPAYAEKNWGASFPAQWFWVQSNSFDEVHTSRSCSASSSAASSHRMDEVSITAAGGKRSVPLAGKEDVAMVGVHFRGDFYEFTPWTGSVEWDVNPWGKWILRGETAEHSVEVVGTCGQHDGVVLRAPNDEEGLSARCKDTFAGNASVTLRKKRKRGSVDETGEIILEASTSGKAALEVGGGPWWSAWRATAQMTEPLQSLVALPVDIDAWLSELPEELQPPGF